MRGYGDSLQLKDARLTPLWSGKPVAWWRSRGWSGREYRSSYVVTLPKASKRSPSEGWANAKVGVAVKTRDGSWRPTYVEWRNLAERVA